MALPEREWYPISKLAEEWKVSEEDVEHYLETKKLSASIRLQPTMLDYMEIDEGYDEEKEEYFDLPSGCPELHEGIFEIENYERIEWEEDSSCNLKNSNIRLSRSEIVDGKMFIDEYEFVDTHILKKNNIIITKESIDSFTEECNYDLSLPCGLKPLEQSNQINRILPYLDPNHDFFSPTLETAVTAWLEVYNSGRFNPKQGHINQITNWLERNRKRKYNLTKTTVEFLLTKNSIEYLAQVVNHNKPGGTPRISNDE